MKEDLITEQYNEFIRAIEIADITLRRVTARTDFDFRSEASKKQMNKIKFKTDSRLDHVADRNLLVASIPFSLRVEAADEEKPFYTLEGEYLAIFFSKKEVPAGTTERFEKSVVLPMVFPYIRRLITTMTADMGLPPLIAPLFKVLPPPPLHHKSERPIHQKRKGVKG